MVATHVSAQDTTNSSNNEADPSFHFGLKLTPTFSWFSIDREAFETDGVYVGYTYGVMMDFRLAKNYFIGTGVEISQQGGKFKASDLEATQSGIPIGGKVTQRLQFVDVPFVLKLKTNEIGYMQYYGQFGFTMGFLVKANQDVDFNDNALGYDDVNKRNNQSDFGPFNFGLNVGIGTEYNIAGNTDITIGIGYHNGFVDIWTPDKAKITTNHITLNFGVFF
jgi:hypothetical protein